MSQTQVKTQLNEYATLFESELNTYLASVSDPLVPNLHDAMRYALGADLADPAQRGKRIRPDPLSAGGPNFRSSSRTGHAIRFIH